MSGAPSPSGYLTTLFSFDEADSENIHHLRHKTVLSIPVANPSVAIFQCCTQSIQSIGFAQNERNSFQRQIRAKEIAQY
jgi:hypothetical protein